jgi:AhpD family alkylhydroperoxidase
VKARIELNKLNPKIMKSLIELGGLVEQSGLDLKLLHLVLMRASQINGCAYCLDMHSKDARADGETEQRLYSLPGWRDAPYYSDRERAALEWTESLTLVAETHAPDSVYERVKTQFSEQEIANLTAAIGVINTFNRLNIGLATVAGDYRPGMFRNREAAAREAAGMARV